MTAEKMNPLFTDLQNHIFTTLCRILTDMDNGISYTQNTLYQALLCRGSSLNVEPIIKLFFHIKSDGTAVSRFPGAAPLDVPPAISYRWLKMMVEDTRFAPLLPTDLAEKLRNLREIQNAVSLLPKNSVCQSQTPRPTVYTKEQESLLSRYHQALLEKQVIFLTDIAGITYTAAPCRLEYDWAADTYTAVIWDMKQSHIHFIPLKEMAAISPAPDTVSFPENLEDLYQNALPEKATVTLQLRNERNEVDRCFRAFMEYDKQAMLDYETDKKTGNEREVYTLTITYYPFDEQEIFETIVSLGKAVTVLKPPTMRQKVIDYLTATIFLYEEK